MRENQLALTGGLRDLVESNRDVLTLQQELPFPGVGEPPKKKIVINLNDRFEEDELKYLVDEGRFVPNELLKLDPKYLEDFEKDVREKRNKISREIGFFKKQKAPEKDVETNLRNLKNREI